MSFIDYLFEKGFISEDVAKYLIPKHLYKNTLQNGETTQEHSKNIHSLTECLIVALGKVKHNPSLFIIENRCENKGTVKHILNNKDAIVGDNETKIAVIDFILKQNLYKSFSKFEHHYDPNRGYVAVYIVKNSIPYFETKGFSRGHVTTHKGTSVYLKFGFKTYQDHTETIEIDPNSIVLEVISIHPTK